MNTIVKQGQVKASRIQLGQLSDVGATLSVEELEAVSGALAPEMKGSWKSGQSHSTDEWTIN
jgi:hypothetical protein